MQLFFIQKEGVNWKLYGLDKNTSKPLHFYKCLACDLIFKDPSIRLEPEKEKSRYSLHNNNPQDPNYEEFLNSLVEPIAKKINPNSMGLDFGCGPEPVIESLFQRRGFNCQSYDPYFKNEEALIKAKYDFVTCSEVVEHFYHPHKEFKLLFGLLNTSAWLGIKTARVPADFTSWWYHKDPTHVVFYSDATFRWIAKKYNAKLEVLPKDVVLLHVG